MSGLKFLYNLILKDAARGSGQASGILSIGKDVRKLADKKFQRYVKSAQNQGVDLDKLSEQEAKYMLELNKPKEPVVLSNEDAYAFLNKFLSQGKKDKGKVIKGKFGKSFSQEVDDIADKKVIEQMYRTSGPRSLDEDAGYLAEFIAEDAGKVLDDLPIKEQTKFIERAKNALRKNVKQYQPEEVVNVDSVIEDIKKLEPIESMKETNKVLRGEGKYKNLSKADREKIAGDESVTDHIFERNIIDETEDFAYGGIAGMLGERTSYRVGKTAKKKKKKSRKIFDFGPTYMPPELAFMEPVNFPYKSLEDIPPNVLAMLKKDPNFDLETFLTKVGWSDADKTRIQEKLRGTVSSGVAKGEDDEAWGLYNPRADMSFLNYQKFGESEPLLERFDIKSPSDADKVQTILHEMRHGKMREPWFMKSSAIPKYVRETDHPHYSFQKYGDDDPNKFVGGEELFVRFMDQHFGDVAEKGSIAGSDYKPYFDKILKDHWDPYAKRYEDILKEEKRVKSKPYGLAGGGIAGLLGERTGFSKGKLANLARRNFMKLLGVGAAGIGALKTGAFKLLSKEAAPIAKETVKQSTILSPLNKPPPYFLNLVNKIRNLGDDTLATKDKAIAKKYKDYVMEEDFAGNIEIIKKGGDDMFPEDVYMSYKVDEVPIKTGKKKSAKVEEYEEYTARPDGDGKMKDVEQGVPDKVIEEGTIFEDNITDFKPNKSKTKKASGGRVPRFKGGIMKLLKTILKKTPKKSYENIDLEKLLKGKDKIPVYSGSMKRSSNTWKSFVEDAEKLGTTPEKIAKDKFKGQWFTPFRSYAEAFMDPKDLTSKMRTIELTPKEIAIAKRYVEKVNKKDMLASMRRKLNIKPFPKQNITTDENLVLIPRYKLKKLKKENRIMTDYLIKDKIKSKLGLAEGGVAGMLGE